MARYFFCPTHGRFPLTQAHPELSIEQVMAGAPDITEAECPYCSNICQPCKGCSHSQVTIAPTTSVTTPTLGITPMMQENWRMTLALHCPSCKIGQICKECGKDYSRGI